MYSVLLFFPYLLSNSLVLSRLFSVHAPPLSLSYFTPRAKLQAQATMSCIRDSVRVNECSAATVYRHLGHTTEEKKTTLSPRSVDPAKPERSLSGSSRGEERGMDIHPAATPECSYQCRAKQQSFPKCQICVFVCVQV